MDCPELYVKANGLQQRDVLQIISEYVEKMTWNPNEIVMDLGCGPGDVTINILYPVFKNKIRQMVSFEAFENISQVVFKTMATTYFSDRC